MRVKMMERINTTVAMILLLLNIFFICLMNPTKNPVDSNNEIFPKVYNNEKPTGPNCLRQSRAEREASKAR